MRGRPNPKRPTIKGRPLGKRGRHGNGMVLGGQSLLSRLATEYWLARNYSGSGSWLGSKGVADLAFPGGSANPTWLPYSTSQNPFGAGVKYVACPGSTGNTVSTADSATWDFQSCDIRVWCAFTDWTPSAIAVIVSHDTTSVSENSRHFLFAINTNGTLYLSTIQDGTGGVTAATGTSSVATGITDGAGQWIRVTRDATTGDVKFYLGGNTATPSWAQLGTTQSTSVITADTSSAALMINGYGATGTQTGTASYARVMVYNGYDGAGSLIADFNPNGGTINSTATTLTGTGDGLTWTLNRSTSGRRLSWIDRDAFWFGTDDYLSVADNANFDFAANQDFTVAALFRARQDSDSNYHYLLSKRTTAANSDVGWALFTGGTGVTEEFGFVLDADAAGATGTIINDTSWNNPGTLQTSIGTRTNGATGDLTLYTDAVSVATGTQAGDVSNTTALNVGRAANAIVYFDGVIHALAIFRTGLTSTQVTQLDAELRGIG